MKREVATNRLTLWHADRRRRVKKNKSKHVVASLQVYLFLSLQTANTTTHRQAKLEIYFKYGSDRVTAKGPQGLMLMHLFLFEKNRY